MNGGGATAERKTEALLRSGALPRVGALVLSEQLSAWAQAGRIEWLAGEFQEAWLDGVWLAIAASDNAAANRALVSAAEARRLLVDVADDAESPGLQVPAEAEEVSSQQSTQAPGSVILVGAGPGDPGLLT